MGLGCAIPVSISILTWTRIHVTEGGRDLHLPCVILTCRAGITIIARMFDTIDVGLFLTAGRWGRSALGHRSQLLPVSAALESPPCSLFTSATRPPVPRSPANIAPAIAHAGSKAPLKENTTGSL